jgi:arsenate reductase (thioredoxin)
MIVRVKVVFVCDHGAAKSVIAAAWFERLAFETGLTARAVARGTEPDPELSQAAAAGLRGEGIDVSGWSPRLLTSEELALADRVVSLGPDLSAIVPDGVPYERWADVPPVAAGYAPARETILARLRPFIDVARA